MYQQTINIELKTDTNGAIRGFGQASTENGENKVQLPLINDFFPCFMCDLCNNILNINIFVTLNQQQETNETIIAPVVNLMPMFETQNTELVTRTPNSNEEGSGEEASSDEDVGESDDAPEPDTEQVPEVPARFYICDTCHRQFKTRFARYHHYKKRECTRPFIRKRPPYVCDICNKTLTTHRGYVLHLKNNSSHAKLFKQTMFTCPECHKTFKSLIGLKSHRFLHVSDKERPFQCDVCDRGFGTKLGLESHVLSHKKRKEFHCPVCDEGKDTKEELREHLITHADELGETPQNCQCPDGLSYQSIKCEETDQ